MKDPSESLKLLLSQSVAVARRIARMIRGSIVLNCQDVLPRRISALSIAAAMLRKVASRGDN